ncbi:hypothetical protein FOZ63_004724, partial [Perkinsus olseni]
TAAECVAVISSYSRLEQREADFLTLVSHRLLACDSLGDATPGVFELTSSAESVKKRRQRHEALPRPSSGDGVTTEQLCVAVSSLGAMDVISPDFARWVTTKVRRYPPDRITSSSVRDIIVGLTRTGKTDAVLFDRLLGCLQLESVSGVVLGALVSALRHVGYRKTDFIKSAVSVARDPVAAALVYHAIAGLDLAAELDTQGMPGLEELLEASNITPIVLSGAMEYFIEILGRRGSPPLEIIGKGFAAGHPTSSLMTAVATKLPFLLSMGDLAVVRALHQLVGRASRGFAKNPPLPKTIVAEVQHTVSRVRYAHGGPAASDCRRAWVTREAGLELYTDILFT